MAASRRPINVEVSQLFTKLIDSSDEIDAGSTARGHAAIAGTPVCQADVRHLQ